MTKIIFRAMGTDMLAVLDQELDSTPDVLNQVPLWFEEWEQSLSRFRTQSELSQLNRTFDQPVQVSAIFWNVYQCALWAEQYTDGLVTPTIFDALVEAGYDQSFESLPRYQNTLHTSGMTMIHPLSTVVADEVAQTICLPEQVHLDFGGVAKGWAAHQAMRTLKKHAPALVNAGGDVAISGPRAGNAEWEIGVKNPFEGGTDFEVLYLKRGGVATSGKDRRRWIQGNRLRHHIIDPKTGQPAQGNLLSATVIAPTVMEAEAAAKAIVIMGSAAGLAWIKSKPNLACLLVLENGDALYSEKMEEYL